MLRLAPIDEVGHDPPFAVRVKVRHGPLKEGPVQPPPAPPLHTAQVDTNDGGLAHNRFQVLSAANPSDKAGRRQPIQAERSSLGWPG